MACAVNLVLAARLNGKTVQQAKQHHEPEFTIPKLQPAQALTLRVGDVFFAATPESSCP